MHVTKTDIHTYIHTYIHTDRQAGIPVIPLDNSKKNLKTSLEQYHLTMMTNILV
jgi:hypothetical protein